MAWFPLAALFVTVARTKTVDRDQLLLSTALMMSFIGDTLATSGLSLSHLWAPAQLILAYAAIVSPWTVERVVAASAACTFTFSLTSFDPSKDPLMWLLGGAGMILIARQSHLIVPVFIYFGAGGVAFFLWIDRLSRPGFDLAIYHRDFLTYQACRFAGILLLCILIVRPLYLRGGGDEISNRSSSSDHSGESVPRVVE
ncbi:MAG: hypothetical protein V3T23_02775 [Nitrososphaerales archaeon]